jgi:tRNA threonylcarbamoyl adenosine modification protein YeaZ
VLLLAFDTATPAVTVALHDGARVLAEESAVDGRRHGELLAASIRSVLAAAGAAAADLTGIAVGVGPGPYTGLRAGLVTARVLGSALGVPVHGACTLDIIARAVSARAVSASPVPGGSVPGGSVPGGSVPGGPVPGGSVPGGSVPGGSVPAGPVLASPVLASTVPARAVAPGAAGRMEAVVAGTAGPPSAAGRSDISDRDFIVATDARRKEIYWARYTATAQRIRGPEVSAPAEVGACCPVAGQGALLYPDELGDPIEPYYPSAGWLASMTAERLGRGASMLPAEPLYLRRPDARIPGPPKRVTP